MANVTFGQWETAGEAAWVARPRGPATLVPGGAMLDEAAFTADANGRKHVPSGTVVGRTYAERDAGTGFGPVAVDGTSGAATDEEVRIVAFDVSDAVEYSGFVMLRPGTEVKENFLPEVEGGTLAAGVLAAVRENYIAVRGVE